MNSHQMFKHLVDQLDRIEEKLNNRVFNVTEVADRYNVTEKTIYRWIKQGELKTIKVGGRLFVKQSELK